MKSGAWFILYAAAWAVFGAIFWDSEGARLASLTMIAVNLVFAALMRRA